MKLTWGTGITIAIICFAGLIVSFVVRASLHRTAFATDNAYATSQTYKDLQARQANLRAVGGHATATLNAAARMLELRVPAAAAFEVEGEIEFQHGARAELDKKLPFAPDSTGLQAIPLGLLPHGRSTLKASWTSRGTEFAYETVLFIP